MKVWQINCQPVACWWCFKALNSAFLLSPSWFLVSTIWFFCNQKWLKKMTNDKILPRDHWSLHLCYYSLHFGPTVRFWFDCRESRSGNVEGCEIALQINQILSDVCAYYWDCVAVHPHAESAKVNQTEMDQYVLAEV